jgi:hypothetical protein
MSHDIPSLKSKIWNGYYDQICEYTYKVSIIIFLFICVLLIQPSIYIRLRTK